MGLAPTGFVPAHTQISGAVELHHVLVGMLERLGHRMDLGDSGAPRP